MGLKLKELLHTAVRVIEYASCRLR